MDVTRMDKVVITGHSRGLGRALAEHYLQQGADVLGLARNKIPDASRLQQISIDLSEAAAIQKLFSDRHLENFMGDAANCLLINNAGTVLPNAVAGRQQAEDIVRAVSINVQAPLLLSNHLIACRPSGCLLKIVHISSGAGRRAYAGWSVYGATKAALDLHARCVAEEGLADVRIESIAPGVVDTAMQEQIRAAGLGEFPLRQRFVDLKNQALLSSPKEAAELVAMMVDKADFGQEVLGDVRTFVR